MLAALKFGGPVADRAVEAWGFNCGPASLCAVLDLTPDEVRPHMQDFERKGYTNPTLMWAALRSLGAEFTVRSTPLGGANEWPRWGLARIQWGGPWTKPGVPIAARYRRTHWVGSCRDGAEHMVFDVNATWFGGWLPFAEWSGQLVPWLLREVEPKADGAWWITHSVEVARTSRVADGRGTP
jgi:hypothetical protein